MLRRLYLQIYFTIVASLVIVVVLVGIVWDVVGSNRANRFIFETAGRFASLTLPPATAPLGEQRDAVYRLSRELEIDISLIDQSGKVIAKFGNPTRPRGHHRGRSGIYHGRKGPAISLTLPDGRRMLADPRKSGQFRPLLYLLAILGIVTAGVGVAAYPLTRRITKRLETLQRGVESMGAGDLSARVDIKGRDEVAQLATSFNDAAEKIQKLVEAHRLLLANASHELRTPLSRIRLGIELEQEEQSPERRAALKEDISELDALIDEILLMSRLDVGAQLNLSQHVDLVALVAEECSKVDDCRLIGSVPEIRGDPKLLQRLLRNLIENAAKYGEPPIEVRLELLGKSAVLTVVDNGEGIFESQRELVFQPFFRGAGNQNVGGYGLGLALVRQIAEAHGGKVEILPRSVEKSAIKVELPIGEN